MAVISIWFLKELRPLLVKCVYETKEGRTGHYVQSLPSESGGKCDYEGLKVLGSTTEGLRWHNLILLIREQQVRLHHLDSFRTMSWISATSSSRWHHCLFTTLISDGSGRPKARRRSAESTQGPGSPAHHPQRWNIHENTSTAFKSYLIPSF